MQVAQSTGSFLDVGLQMIERALEFFVALARELAQVASQHATLALEESGQLVFELGVKIGRASQHTGRTGEQRRSSRLILSSMLPSWISAHSATVRTEWLKRRPASQSRRTNSESAFLMAAA